VRERRGGEGAGSAPKAKAWPPRTIFLAPALHWRRLYVQLNRVHSALELSGRCALQNYLLTYLLTYLTLTRWPWHTNLT